MNQDILIFAEQRDGIVQKISYELAGGARKLTAGTRGKVIALLAGSFEESELIRQTKMLVESGADIIYTVNSPELAEYLPPLYIEVLSEAARKVSPSILLVGSTTIGIDLAPEVSLRLDTGLVSDCTGLMIEEESGLLLMERPGIDGQSIDIFNCPGRKTVMATVRPGVLSALHRAEAEGSVIEIPLSTLVSAFVSASPSPHTTLLETQRGRKRTADITEAAVLVAGGRGIGGPEGFIPLQKIADLLGGEIACSRACVEAGWIDTSPQVGQTGKTVRPELYLSFGISGAFQHVTGMEKSGLIISVNKNPAAPIFDISDLGIVGNVENILPALIRALEEAKTSP